MTDLHTHILYGVDDGSESLEMSLEMLQMASDTGTHNLVLTPHCNVPDGYMNHMNSTIIGRYEKIKQEVKRLHIDIDVHLGMEVFASEDVDELIKAEEIIPINKTRYLLIEFAFETDPMWVGYVLEKVQRTGLTPLLAHPERYIFVQNFPYMVHDWMKSGCMIQVNRGSVMGRFGQVVEETAHFLIEHGFVHVIASDAHRPYTRTPVLNDAYDCVADYYGVMTADRLFKINPRRILTNQKIISSSRHDSYNPYGDYHRRDDYYRHRRHSDFDDFDE